MYIYIYMYIYNLLPQEIIFGGVRGQVSSENDKKFQEREGHHTDCFSGKLESFELFTTF